MRFHLAAVVGLSCVVTYSACGSSDDKVRTSAEGGESGEGGDHAGESAGQAGESGSGGASPATAGAAGHGGAVTPADAGAGGGGGTAAGGASGEGGSAGTTLGGEGGSAGLGGASGSPGSGGEGGRAEASVKVVFVSSVAYTGNLGGLDGADAKCAALALAAGLPGTFKAWLSDSTGSPSTRFTQATVDYVLTNGTVFAHGWSDLISPSPKPAFDVNELGGSPPTSDTACAGLNGGYAAWVSSNADGTPAPNVAAGDHSCSNWSSTAVETSTVGLGSPIAGNSWVGFCSSGVPSCSKQAAIFCFEQ